MKTIIIIAIIAFNIFSIILSWKMLKGYDLKRKIILIIVNEIINFLMLLIIYAFSSKNIPTEIHQHSKFVIISTILPINVMITSTTILNLINKLAFKEIKEESFNKKICMSVLLIIVILILEISYLHNIQIDISKIKQ